MARNRNSIIHVVHLTFSLRRAALVGRLMHFTPAARVACTAPTGGAGSSFLLPFLWLDLSTILNSAVVSISRKGLVGS